MVARVMGVRTASTMVTPVMTCTVLVEAQLNTVGEFRHVSPKMPLSYLQKLYTFFFLIQHIIGDNKMRNIEMKNRLKS